MLVRVQTVKFTVAAETRTLPRSRGVAGGERIVTFSSPICSAMIPQRAATGVAAASCQAELQLVLAVDCQRWSPGDALKVRGERQLVPVAPHGWNEDIYAGKSTQIPFH